MESLMASTWFTTLTAIRAQDPDWEAIACYHEPVRRFLLRAFPGLPADLADDVTQEVLCAMRTSVVARFDPERGRFRDYLRGVIRNQVRKALAARRANGADEALAAVAAPQVDPDEVEHVDLEARLLLAVRGYHDELLGQGARGREVLYCLSGRLVDGLTYPQLAKREGVSLDAVKRRLQAARRGILRALLQGELATAGVELAPKSVGALAERAAEAIATGRELDVPWRLRREQVAAAETERLVRRVRAARSRFPGLDSPDGQAFLSALAAILEPEASGPNFRGQPPARPEQLEPGAPA
jgi:RNA polymerase sigma factor (sigma-70 family)